MKTRIRPSIHLDEIRHIHAAIKSEIEAQLARFDALGRNGSDEEIFCELVFCLLTPQSGAYRCARAVEILKDRNLILHGCSADISRELNIVRFRNKKSEYICLARETFSVQGRIAIKELLARQGDVFNRREWLVRHVKGMGYKEASHFLRNTGDGARLAILDRHILKNLEILGVTGSIPGSLTRNRYLEIEDSMREFSAAIGIPMDHLDFVLWFKEAGSVFK